jgi:type IV pilus assembly protein PilQ
MNPKHIHFGLAVTLAIGLAAILPCRTVIAADEELSIEEDAAPPAAASPAPAKAAAPAAKKAVAKPAARQGSVILRINVVPLTDRVEIRVGGRGSLVPEIIRLADENKLVLDFKGATYRAPAIVLGAPGIGEVAKVRGGQFQAGTARVVIELKKMVAYTSSSKAGVFVLVLETPGTVGPEEEAMAPASPAPAASGTVSGSAAAAAQEPPVSAPAEGGVRSRLLHAMVSDLDDRVRLVATSDGVVKYKIASQDAGKELVLTLYDMDLKWTPARIDLKDGPIASVRAEEVRKPVQHVRLDIKLRQALPYHVKRDQNQVVIEVERAGDAAASAAAASTKGDLMHRVTLNVQGEDLASLVKGLAFEAGFENVVVSQKSVTGVQPVTISLRDVPLAKALNLILAPEGLVWKVEKNVLKVAKSDVFDAELEASAVSGGSGNESDSGDEESGIVTRVFRLRYVNVLDDGDASAVVNSIATLLQNKKQGKVVVDGRVNALIVTDNSGNIKLIERVIRQLDISVPQVMIEARLIQIDTNKISNLGIDWKAEGNTPSNPQISGVFPNPKGSFNVTTALLGPGFNLETVLSALITNNDAKLILNPRIATVDNRVAMITTERSVPYNTNILETVGGVQQTRVVQNQVSVPITLAVIPHVNPNKTVILDVQIVASTDSAADPGVMPLITRQTARTQLIVRDGETAVIGGMLTESVRQNSQKVPLLGDLPWFLGGALFRHETSTRVKGELVLFLKPQIVPEF